VEGEHSHVLGKAVRFQYSQGHTPGLMLSEIAGPHDREGVVYCADLIPGTPWVHLPVTMGYDRAPETLIDEKHAFLDDNSRVACDCFSRTTMRRRWPRRNATSVAAMASPTGRPTFRACRCKLAA